MSRSGPGSGSDGGRAGGTVAIDARAAARPELGGVERWARELRDRLPALRPAGYDVLEPPPALSHRAGHAWEQGWLPLRARRARWLLCPANLAPLVHPRVAVVLHDAAPLHEPGWYAPAYARLQAQLLPRVAHRARMVITVSEFSRRELRELVGVEAHVVEGGVDLERFTPQARTPVRPAGRYVLTVASQTRRKNLVALGETARRLREQGIALVAAGGGRPQFAAEGELPLQLLGHVDDADLPGLYAGAEAFVLPSLHEGYGLPVLEAMACGTPVVCADAGGLPEAAGGAARLVDPTDQRAIADAVMATLDDPAGPRAGGLARVEGRTWDATARAVDALLQHGPSAATDPGRD